MMAWVVLAAGWLTGGWFAFHQRPDLSALDLRRCYASHQIVYCWPKRGVFMVGDRALAWQVQPVKPR